MISLCEFCGELVTVSDDRLLDRAHNQRAFRSMAKAQAAHMMREHPAEVARLLPYAVDLQLLLASYFFLGSKAPAAPAAVPGQAWEIGRGEVHNGLRVLLAADRPVVVNQTAEAPAAAVAGSAASAGGL